MLHHIRAWLDRSGPVPAEPTADELAAARAEIQRLETLAADRGFVADKLEAESAKLSVALTRVNLKLSLVQDTAAELRDELGKARVELAKAADRPCVCGGDAELHWRTKAEQNRREAVQHQANCYRMADQLADMRSRLEAGNGRVAYRSAR